MWQVAIKTSHTTRHVVIHEHRGNWEPSVQKQLKEQGSVAAYCSKGTHSIMATGRQGVVVGAGDWLLTLRKNTQWDHDIKNT